uniref:Tripartite motif-containing protein 16-like n=1 Tax=Erpetoichthys calabaricus TaxID=27687 RepID=A0A8C4RLA2_ERPCA
MAEGHLLVLQDEFTCLVCLKTLSDPVSIPCGHSFCMKCLTDCWDQSQECSCPQCRRTFTTRPELHINTVLSDTEKLCEKHQKCLEIFCTTDEMCICIMCVVSGHEGHKMVTLEMKREEKQVRVKGFINLSVLCSAPSPVTHSQISSLIFFSLLSDFCPLTLDINTVHRWLRLSDGNKEVTHDRTKTKYPNHPERFDCWPQVLCREALTGTRCYWEVECTGESLRIGVAYKGMSRKGWGLDCCLGHNDKSWCLFCSNSEYSVSHNNKDTVISAPYSPRIGVYLDWPASSLSFYSISHTMTLLHRFNTSFTEPLYPGFLLGFDSSVTICHLTAGDH